MTTPNTGSTPVGHLAQPPDAPPPGSPSLMPPDTRDPSTLTERRAMFGDDPATAMEVIITGKNLDGLGALAAEPVCLHGSFLQEVVAAEVVTEEGVHHSWRIQVRVKCALCARDFAFTGETLVSNDRLTIGALMIPDGD